MSLGVDGLRDADPLMRAAAAQGMTQLESKPLKARGSGIEAGAALNQRLRGQRELKGA